MHDLVIRNGQLVDGTGAAPVDGMSVAIDGAVIVGVGTGAEVMGAKALRQENEDTFSPFNGFGFVPCCIGLNRRHAVTAAFRRQLAERGWPDRGPEGP